MSKKILLTGATGFVGNAIMQRIVADNQNSLTIAVRRNIDAPSGVTVAKVDGLSAETDWSDALSNIDVVVHAAARVHVMQDNATDPLAEYRRVNVAGTVQLAKQAVASGVKRFVFISSIKVNGESTSPNSPFTAESKPQPTDPYGISKYEAEQALFEIGNQTGLEIVVIRPVLVYGPGVKANFLTMLSWVNKGIPLPLGAIHNQRSILYLQNLVDLVITCVKHPAAANQVFLASDKESVSTTQMLQHIGRALNQPARLLPVPVSWLNTVFTMLGKKGFTERLCGSLQVNIDKNKSMLGWQPPYSTSEAMQITAQHYLHSNITYKVNPLLRIFDVGFAFFGLLFGFPILLLIYLVGLFDTGSPLFLQERVGRNKKPFTLVKFRTMNVGTASVASHLASASSVTRMGSFLRKTKLDELPQLWNVLKGEMSLVGPRPNLFNQEELIAERDALEVYKARPGITGLAQVNGIDMSVPKLLAQTDATMLRTLSVGSYFKYIIQTVTGKGSGDRIKKG